MSTEKATKPNTTVAVRLDDETHTKLIEYALRANLSTSNALRTLIKVGLSTLRA